MTYRLRIVPIAQGHIRAAADWWDKNRTAAPDLFMDEIKRAFRLITEQPEIAPIARDTQAADVRRFHLSRIRYNVYYRHRDDMVEVLAVWHSSRGTGPDL